MSVLIACVWGRGEQNEGSEWVTGPESLSECLCLKLGLGAGRHWQNADSE